MIAKIIVKCIIFNKELNKLLLIQRCTKDDIGANTWENAGGNIEDGESPEEAVFRELKEETGYESDEWTHLISVPSDATICDNYAHLFRAVNCRRVSDQSLDDMEFIKYELYNKQQIYELISGGEFEQAMHILAWQLADK